MSSWSDFKTEIKKSEGCISHMYLDTVGKVTVGVGNMLPDVAAAQKLGFVVRITKKKATDAEIKADFDAVAKQTKGKQTKGKLASTYKLHTKLDLPATIIDTLLDSRIAEFKKQLKVKFPDFDTYPIGVQFALTDMAFNLGTNGLVTKFPTFTTHIKAKEWTKAAGESNRPQVNAERNKTVKTWLETAVAPSIL